MYGGRQGRRGRGGSDLHGFLEVRARAGCAGHTSPRRRRRRLMTRRARNALGTATQCTRRNDSPPPPPGLRPPHRCRNRTSRRPGRARCPWAAAAAARARDPPEHASAARTPSMACQLTDRPTTAAATARGGAAWDARGGDFTRAPPNRHAQLTRSTDTNAPPSTRRAGAVRRAPASRHDRVRGARVIGTDNWAGPS
jgi:hypothetical protein